MDRAILEEMVSVEDIPDVDMDKETKEADDIAIRGFYLSRKSKAILDPSKVMSSTASNKLKEEPSNTMIETTMFSMANTESVCNLWELDVLGIQDPLQKKTKEKRAEETHKFFLDTVRINEQGFRRLPHSGVYHQGVPSFQPNFQQVQFPVMANGAHPGAQIGGHAPHMMGMGGAVAPSQAYVTSNPFYGGMNRPQDNRLVQDFSGLNLQPTTESHQNLQKPGSTLSNTLWQ
ncbi:hypothetical protein GE061_008474 [Apolygus lucorum]|uniref:Uncharacterized protein n=1 Tax=Apolygus lucorum TaxID=248454 RepID=A0A8S9WIV5_APOLU|nr:hypothetical protein GE061_008474 [Apolygus lucorum]